MNLKETASLLGWKREQVEIAIIQGIETPIKKSLTKLAAAKQSSGYDIREEDVDSFLAAFEAEDPGRYPPVSVRRKLLIEAGYQCAVCNSDAPLRFHHIVDWANLKHHDPNHMLAICGTCHDKIGLGIIETKAQKEIKAALAGINFTGKAQVAHESLSCLIELDDRLLAIGGEEALVLAIDEIAAEFQVGREPQIKVRIDKYSEAKAELTKIEAKGIKSHEERQRAFQLRQILQKYDIWDRRLDELFEEMVLLVVKNFRKIIGFITKKELARTLQAGFSLRFASAVVSGVKFDVFRNDGDDVETGFGIWLTESQAEELAKNQGASNNINWLTRNWGLDLFNLPHEALVKYVIPSMVQDYLWWKYEKKRPRVSDEKYFNLHSWQVGLG